MTALEGLPENVLALMRRREQELQRRGQPLPSFPIERPEPGEGCRQRMERMKAARAAG
jgi:hypothetical protein